MSWRDLQDKSIAFSVDDSLELFNDRGMKFVEFVLREHLADKFPQDNPIGVLDGLGRLDVFD